MVKSIAEIMEEIRRTYKKNPRGWRMLGSVDERGHRDLFFYGPKVGLWQIKGEFRTPYELVGAGAKIAERIDDRISKVMEQGQPMPFGLVSPHPTRENRLIIAAGVGKYSEDEAPMQKILSGKQCDVDREIRARVEKLCHELGINIGYG